MNNSIPVFVFPNEINYTPKLQTQTITLYNPYDFHLKYSILCTKPNAFSLSCSEGIIRSRYCIDILIRILDQSITEEKFLIEVKELPINPNVNKLGQKKIKVFKRNSDLETHDSEERSNFSPIIQTQVNVSEINSREFNQNQINPKLSNQLMAYLVAFICIIVLLLPHESSQSNWFTICFTHKLVVSYVLGLLTVVILRN